MDSLDAQLALARQKALGIVAAMVEQDLDAQLALARQKALEIVAAMVERKSSDESPAITSATAGVCAWGARCIVRNDQANNQCSHSGCSVIVHHLCSLTYSKATPEGKFSCPQHISNVATASPMDIESTDAADTPDSQQLQVDTVTTSTPGTSTIVPPVTADISSRTRANSASRKSSVSVGMLTDIDTGKIQCYKHWKIATPAGLLSGTSGQRVTFKGQAFRTPYYAICAMKWQDRKCTRRSLLAYTPKTPR